MTKSEFDIMAELEQAGAVLLDYHFCYSSGKHGSGYINMDPIFTNSSLLAEIGQRLWSPFSTAEISTIVAPATGGIALAYATAFAVLAQTSGGTALSVAWADKNGKEFEFSRAGFPDRIAGKGVLIIEDLLTTGDSVAKVGREVERLGGVVRGVSAVCNRGDVTAAAMRVPRLVSLARANFTAVAPEKCDLCAMERPMVSDVGHGDEFAAEHPDYKGGFITLLS